MKKFPRIYSLSTVGLIHHREFDYLFHGFRTDFVGESGVGKSMIADLIQLIFVGSDVFESATRGNDTRDPDGMVLDDQQGGKGIGYAFLNVQKSPVEWLVVGVYLERGIKNSQAFLIQQGFNSEHPGSLSGPLSYKQFLKGDKILPLEQLKSQIGDQGLYCRSWQRYKRFHEILFNENILPLNVASGDRVLKDYAAILQSFSRGKMLDTRSSDSLCQFLFGNEAAQKIWVKFQEAIKELENSVGEYGQNLSEIQRVTAKQKALVALQKQKAKRDDAQRQWLLQELRYWQQEERRLKREVDECVITYLKAKQYKTILEDILTAEVLATKENVQNLEEESDRLNTIYEEILPRFKAVESARKLRRGWDGSDEELRQKFNDYQEHRRQKTALQDLEKKLKEAAVAQEFADIPAKESFFGLQEYVNTAISELRSQLNTKNALKNYVRITDQESLGYWALQQKRAFSLEEESAILAFQQLPRKKTAKADYLPTPAELIYALSIVEKETDGFWINLSSIRRFIPYTTTPIFQSYDEAKIRSFFEQYSNQLEKEVTELTRKRQQYEKIRLIVTEISSPSLAIEAYKQKEQHQQQKDIPEWNISIEAFNEALLLSADQEQLGEQFLEAKEAKDKNKQTLDAAKSRLLNLEHYSRRYLNKKLPIEEDLLSPTDYTGEIMDPELERENIEGRLATVQNPDTLLGNELDRTDIQLKTIVKLPELLSTRKEIEVKLTAAERQYRQVYDDLPTDIEAKYFITGFTVEKENFWLAEQDYLSKFKNLVDNHIATEAYRFENTKDFVELATHLLPEAFRNTILQPSENSVIETIESYLIRINEKNRQLNSRKIQKIKTLLDEVDEAITYQENTARRIDVFLRNAAKITGGYSARLRRGKSTQYPKTWITTFKDMLEDREQSEVLYSALGEKIDLTGMMHEAFVQCTGSSSLHFNIRNVLHPSKYIELAFNMESDSGRINKGSTGQTYAAVAMLCIARLSIMSNEESKEPAPAVRIMPIDEAEGLGSNYDMLYEIAQQHDYQLLSLSVNPVGKFKDGEQYIYMLHKNMEVEAPVNGVPIAILCESDKEFIDTSDER